MNKIGRIGTTSQTCSRGAPSGLSCIPVTATPGFYHLSFARLHSLTLFFILFLFAATNLSAQSVYTPAGKSSFGAQFGFSSNKDATSFDTSAGVSILGWGDLEIGYSTISFEEKFFGEDLSASVLSFSASILPVKQSKEIPVSIQIGFAFGFATYDSYALDYYDWDMTAGIFGLGLSLYHKVDLSPSFALVPSVGFSYTNTTLTIEDSYGDSIEESDKESGLSVGLGFLFSLTRSSSLVLKPNLFFTDGEATFGISLGIVGVF